MSTIGVLFRIFSALREAQARLNYPETERQVLAVLIANRNVGMTKKDIVEASEYLKAYREIARLHICTIVERGLVHLNIVEASDGTMDVSYTLTETGRHRAIVLGVVPPNFWTPTNSACDSFPEG